MLINTVHGSVLSGAALERGSNRAPGHNLQCALSRGPDVSAKLSAAPSGGVWPNRSAEIDLDFVNQRYWSRHAGQDALHKCVSGWRYTNKYYMDGAGLLRIMGDNQFLPTYWGGTEDFVTNGTGTPSGLLIEETCINYALWCRDLTNVVWTKTDINAALDQTGLDGVANSASSLTATGNGGTCLQPATTASANTCFSVYLKRIIGAGTVELTINGGSTWTPVTLSTEVWRQKYVSATLANPIFGIRLGTSGDAVAIDFSQLKRGSFYPSTPVYTTSSTVTRNGDSLVFPTTIFNQDSCSFIVSFKRNATIPANPGQLPTTIGSFGVNNDGTTNYHDLNLMMRASDSEVENIYIQGSQKSLLWPMSGTPIQAATFTLDRILTAIDYLGNVVTATNGVPRNSRYTAINIGHRNSEGRHCMQMLRRFILFNKVITKDRGLLLAKELVA